MLFKYIFMRYFLTLILFYISSAIGYCQSIDERLSNAINDSKWFDVRQLYAAHSNEIQIPILHPLSKFFICHFYNKPDSALYYGTQLLNEHQAGLGGSVGSLIFLMARDFAKKGEYANAAIILKQYNDVVKASGVIPDSNFIAFENQYSTIAQKGGFSVSFPQKDIKIPFKYLGTRAQPGQLRVNVKLNNRLHSAVYDIGAGENLISKQLADKLGLYVYDFAGSSLAGINVSKTSFTIVDSLRLGEIVYKNVPFQVVDFNTGHQEADSVIKKIELYCVIGVQSMLPLEEIQLDFKNGFLKIPAYPSKEPTIAPNIYCSGENTFVMLVLDKKTNKNIEAMLDTGSAMTNLTSKYYSKNKSLFDDVILNDSVRIAGIGGIKVLKTIPCLWEYSLDGNHFMKESIVVNTDSDMAGVSKYDCLFGLPSFTKHDYVTINFKNMWIHFSNTKTK